MRPLTLDELRRMVFSLWDHLEQDGYFQEAWGYACVDAGDVEGYLGLDPAAHFLRHLNRDQMWHWRKYGSTWDEDEILDMVEALNDLVSKPTKGDYHSYNDCGWHYHEFDREAGREAYRAQINPVLARWATPYALEPAGEIVLATPSDFAALVTAPLPHSAHPEAVRAKVDQAITDFRTRGATRAAREDAVRRLFDVLEALKPEIKSEMMSQDESDLFQLANKFAIRHNNPQQKRHYDGLIWLTWMFYVNLATIHALLRVIERDRPDPK